MRYGIVLLMCLLVGVAQAQWKNELPAMQSKKAKGVLCVITDRKIQTLSFLHQQLTKPGNEIQQQELRQLHLRLSMLTFQKKLSRHSKKRLTFGRG
ncbi:MAG: hypothetical protein HWD62_13785 [Cyclobacteriaceae bacterium]|nr:MAG: hypothetical protein HWD62_13785 [Cyclobacteriaceae bacterium]